jgi:hypothetical protein
MGISRKAKRNRCSYPRERQAAQRQVTQKAAQQAEPNHRHQHQHKEQPRPERPALDLVLGELQVLFDMLLVFGVQAAGHKGLVR